MSKESRRMWDIINNACITDKISKALWQRRVDTGKPIWIIVQEILAKELGIEQGG